MTRTVTIINILLGIACVTLLAAITADRLSHRIDSSLFPQSSRTPSTAPAVVKTADLSYYSPILTSGLFGKAAQGQLSPIVNSPSSSQAAPATAPAELLLLGTATGSFRETFALVRHTTKLRNGSSAWGTWSSTPGGWSR